MVIGKASGRVRVKKPGSKTFVDVGPDEAIPFGSTIDAKHGVVVITSVSRAGGKPQSARFYDGIFKVTQTGPITNLTLVEALAACPRRGAHAAARKPKTRRLWGNGKGSFRTTGRYSAATIRGTKWLVQDSCKGTLTRVAKGVVTVRDKVRHRTVVVRAPKSYLAKPRR
jgi:hypothetical protein